MEKIYYENRIRTDTNSASILFPYWICHAVDCVADGGNKQGLHHTNRLDNMGNPLPFHGKNLKTENLLNCFGWQSILWQQNDVQCVAIPNLAHDAMTTIVLIVGIGLSHQKKIQFNIDTFLYFSYFTETFKYLCVLSTTVWILKNIYWSTLMHTLRI